MDRTFTGEEFLQALSTDSVTVPLTLTGMAKTADAAGAIRFALGTACKDWVTIPVSLIDHVEPLQHVPCDDHAHPLVRLVLKDTGTPEFTVLTSLLRLMRQQTSPCGAPARSAENADSAPRRPARVDLFPPARHAPGGAAESTGAAAAGARAECLDGDTKCDANGVCWGCCAGDWFNIGQCVFGLMYGCNGTHYKAVSCWPIG
ncbi:hypothetical protein AB0C81_04205 [Streptomyces roseoverticillatus]|uniref:hypothetical protein n=1 Tax=Streptomyces roseoverticillatus TaxID=66429 RepID=UPI0033D44168